MSISVFAVVERWIYRGAAIVISLGVLAGCGTTQGSLASWKHARAKALAAWDRRTGYNWDAYVDGFQHGWRRACIGTLRTSEAWQGSSCLAGARKVNPDDGTLGIDESPAPRYPPPDPWAQGFIDGWNIACGFDSAALLNAVFDTCPSVMPDVQLVYRPRAFQ